MRAVAPAALGPRHRRQPGERLADDEAVVDLAREGEAVEEARLRVAGVALHEREPGAVDQRLDEPAVVAEAAAQLERLVEVLLGVLGGGR